MACLLRHFWLLYQQHLYSRRHGRPCPDFVDPDEPDDPDSWLNDPDQISNARWYAEQCFARPACKK